MGCTGEKGAIDMGKFWDTTLDSSREFLFLPKYLIEGGATQRLNLTEH